jgi:hypothetical protein
MAPEAFGRAAKTGAVKLRHNVFHLTRFHGNVFGQYVVQTAAGRCREGILRSGIIIRATPRICAALAYPPKSPTSPIIGLTL